MIDRKKHGGAEIGGVDQGAVEGDSQGFFTDPRAAQAFHGFGRRWYGRVGGEVQRSLDGGSGFFAPGVAEKEQLGQPDGGGEIGAAQEGGDQTGEEPGGKVAGGVTVGEGGQAAAHFEGDLGLKEQPGGGGAHDAAAAFAVVEGLGHAAHMSRAQGREAGGAGGAQRPHLGEGQEAAFKDLARGVEAAGLGLKPGAIGAVDGGNGVGVGQGQKEALGGEEGHLGVVGEAGDAVVELRVASDPGGAEAVTDLGQGEKLDGCAESIADGAAEETCQVGGIE